MEFFRKSKRVVLRNQGTYLFAKDGLKTVVFTSDKSSKKVEWEVELVKENHHLIRLKSCSGQYLTATEEDFFLGGNAKKVVQTPPPNSLSNSMIEWEPIKVGDRVKLKSKMGTFLGRSGDAPPWRRAIATRDLSPFSSDAIILWEVIILQPVTDVESQRSNFSEFSSKHAGQEDYGEVGGSDAKMIKVIPRVFKLQTQEEYLGITKMLVDGPFVQKQRQKQRCLEFFNLFPLNYEFYKDDMIQLWEAEFFIGKSDAECVFGEFEQTHGFHLSRVDNSSQQPMYKLGISTADQIKQYPDNGFLRINSVTSSISENVLHISLHDNLDPAIFETLYQATHLLTLFILHESPSQIDQVPYDLFPTLPFLRALSLCHTNITELPSSIGDLKVLRYLNLSWTPIRMLPDSVCSLIQLIALNLRGCSKLLGLPQGITKLKLLKYLNVDVACLLASMPPGIGNLTHLQTLAAFFVGEDEGYHITELKHMVNLCGTLRIFSLENISCVDHCQEAALDQKQFLNKLEFHWTDLLDGFDILEKLQPNRNLQELKIVGYGGTALPSWISNPLFSSLTTITIHDCPMCEFLPPLGKLPSLKFLCISNMDMVKVIEHSFYGRNTNCMLKAFPSLENFTLSGMTVLENWSGMEEGDFPHLKQLNISDCSNLTAFPELSFLCSLQQIDISFCPLLESLGNGGLPSSLQYLVIIDCPLLRDRCNKEDSEHWKKLAHVPSIKFDYQEISQGLCQDVLAQLAPQGDSQARSFNEEITRKHSTCSDLVSTSKMDDSDGSGRHLAPSRGSAPTHDDPSSSFVPLPPLLEEPSFSSSEAEENDPLPAVDNPEIMGGAYPGQELVACGYSINGTTSCIFKWVRHLEDGSANYIDGANEPTYVVTADDIDAYLALELQPLDDRKRYGEVVKLFANDQKKIVCDPAMQETMQNHIYNGSASYDVSVVHEPLNIWARVTLDIERDHYIIRRFGSVDVIHTEEFQPKISVSISSSYPTAFSIVGTAEVLLRADSILLRDTIVLTMRSFITRALEEEELLSNMFA